MQLLGRRYDTAQHVELEIAQGKITRATPCRRDAEETRRWPWIAPGLIDIQLNGHGGQEFNSADLTVEGVHRITGATGAFGVTQFCPTLTTAPLDVMQHALGTIAAACDSSAELSRRIAGIHVEGPYLSTQDGPRGAHPREHCRQPNWDEFRRLQDVAGGRIRLLTMAVELDAAAAFIEQATAGGIVVAIGHTAADASQIRAAIDAGARLSTHLGNGCHLMLPRHQNYIWEQLADDRLSASLIVDGHHLPPAVVKTFVRAKTPQRCILVSDMAGQAGLPAGRYAGSLGDVEVLPEGRLVVAGQRKLLAGASAPLGAGVANVMRFAEVGLAEAIRMAVDHPAELLGICPGGLQPGDAADLVLFDLEEHLEVRATLLGGELVFGSL